MKLQQSRSSEFGQMGLDGWSMLINDIPLILMGHSMGSFAIQQCLVDYSNEIDAVRCFAKNTQ